MVISGKITIKQRLLCVGLGILLIVIALILEGAASVVLAAAGGFYAAAGILSLGEKNKKKRKNKYKAETGEAESNGLAFFVGKTPLTVPFELGILAPSLQLESYTLLTE
jgi:hypothetical protein